MFDRTETRPFRRLAGVSAGMLMLAACTSSGVTNSLNTSDIDRAGGPAGSGGVCAYYSGTRSSGRLAPNNTFRRRACFSSASACQAWLYQVQSRFPVTQLRKPCGS